jgi:hypothetical protein
MSRIASFFLIVVVLLFTTLAHAQTTNSTSQTANPTVFSQLQEVTKGLIYSSESDHEMVAISKSKDALKGAQTPQDVALALYEKENSENPEAISPNVEVKSVTDFFANLTVPQKWWDEEERLQAEKFNKLIGVLQKLEEVRVFKIGNGPDKTVYIIGIDTSTPGTFTGVTTVVTES